MDDDDGRGGGSSPGDKGVRVEGVVPAEGDREAIRLAAEAAGTSVRQFVGRAALAASTGPGLEIARLEHLTDVQAQLMEQLGTLRDGQRSVARIGEELVEHNAVTHGRLDEAVNRLAQAQEQITDTLDAQVRTQMQVAEALAAHRETHDRLVALLGSVDETVRTVTEGLRLIRQIETRVRCPEALGLVGYLCEQVVKLERHLGLDPGEPPPECGGRQAIGAEARHRAASHGRGR